VRDGPLGGDAGDLERDGIRLIDPDPDGQVALGRLVLEDDDMLAAWHVNADAVHLHFGEAALRQDETATT
jgi:hypothetical protein